MAQWEKYMNVPHLGVPIVQCHYLRKNVTGLNIRENSCGLQTEVFYLIFIGKIFVVRPVLGLNKTLLLNIKNTGTLHTRKMQDVLIKSVFFCKLMIILQL